MCIRDRFDAGLDDEISDNAASEEIDEEVDKGVDKGVDKELGDVDEHALPSVPNNADDIPSFTASDDKPTSADGGAGKPD